MISEQETRETVVSVESHLANILSELRTIAAETRLLSSVIGDLVTELRPAQEPKPAEFLSIPLIRAAPDKKPSYHRKTDAPRGDRRYSSERVVVKPTRHDSNPDDREIGWATSLTLINIENAPSSMEMLADSWKQGAAAR